MNPDQATLNPAANSNANYASATDIQAEWSLVQENEFILDDQAAAAALTALLSKKITRKEKTLFPHERQLLDLYIHIGTSSLDFKYAHIHAIRTTLSPLSPFLELMEILVRADLSNRLLENEGDLIGMLLRVGRNMRLSLNHQFGEDWVLEMLDMMLSHGAPVNGLDEEGNTPLYTCCRLGNFEAFERLTAAGADLRTLHKSIRGDASQKVNLLQIELDASLRRRDDAPIQLYMSSASAYLDTRYSLKWFTMTEFLIDAGLPFDSDHPAIV
ncbi:hypothetical protein G7Y89_g10795 [Cudoniella acicularis]|uniref:Uncharacterized protein n=1 Tax=Cudoniella acicularis TaxID=354080 RepID=A0A8H4W189_9HELO|nr:hypothetical protein G7Y89_g10795 [Cudoniella acicularis]